MQVRQLLRRSGEGRVVATCRAPGSAAELQKLKEEHAPGRLTVLPLDVTDENTIEVSTRAAFQPRSRSAMRQMQGNLFDSKVVR